MNGGAADLVRLWPVGSGGGVRAGIGALLLSRHGEQARRDPLGVRNQRMLALHRAAVGRPVEAVVTCPGCGADNEFVVPVDGIRALPEPPQQTVVRLAFGGVEARFRLPTAGRLDERAGAWYAAGLRELADRTCLESDPPPLTTDDLTRLAQR